VRLHERICLVLVIGCLLAGSFPAAGQEEERREVKPVLLVMDVQNIWMPMMAEADREAALPRINEAIALFREYGHPVIRVYHSDPERGPEPGSEDFAFVDSVGITEEDRQLVKHRSSAFAETELQRILEEDGRNVVFLCGLSATGCALATYFGGWDHDFQAVMIKDTLLSPNPEHTNAVEEMCATMTLVELRELLEDPYF
jgi:nicotinamidase-related amidase